jgi:hypothetical protein
MTVTSPRVHAQVTVICVLEALNLKELGAFCFARTFAWPGAILSLEETLRDCKIDFVADEMYI